MSPWIGKISLQFQSSASKDKDIFIMEDFTSVPLGNGHSIPITIVG